MLHGVAVGNSSTIDVPLLTVPIDLIVYPGSPGITVALGAAVIVTAVAVFIEC